MTNWLYSTVCWDWNNVFSSVMSFWRAYIDLLAFFVASLEGPQCKSANQNTAENDKAQTYRPDTKQLWHHSQNLLIVYWLSGYEFRTSSLKITHILSHGSKYNMTDIFRVSHILPIYFTSLQVSEITAKYAKWGRCCPHFTW